MLSHELKNLFRQEMADGAEPYLWSDAEVYACLDDAQKMFCRLTDGISDATTPDVVEIAVSAGATWLDLHPAVLKVRAVSRDSDGAGVEVLNYEDLAARGLRLDNRAGPLQAVIAGMEENKLRLACTAAVADTLRMLVFRLPLFDIDGKDLDLEIPAQHHYHLLDWMKGLALMKPDTEVYDPTKAAEYKAAFISYCELARIEQGKKRHKVRTVAYGGL